MDLIRRKHNNILLHVIDIGERKITIPVVQLGTGEGKNILITAGVDGDEYAGIEAAYALIELYSKEKFPGRLTLIPILNIPGFESATSWNPLDNKYPKHIFPGKEKGSSTEKLMYWLSSNFVKDTDLWIDLHSGASTEKIDPFIQIWESNKKEMNKNIHSLLVRIKANTIVLSKGLNSALVKRNCIYIRLESGDLGKRDKSTVKQHMDWVKQLLSESNKKSSPRALLGRTINVYEQVREFLAEKSGIWVPVFVGKTVKKGMMLGEIRSLDGKVIQKISAKENGVFLWRREAMYSHKNDSLYAYAYSKQRLMI